MKYLFVISFAILGNFVFGQEMKENDKDSESGLVYFIRGNKNEIYQSAFSAMINSEIVCKLNSQTYSAHEVPVGEHAFEAQFDEKTEKNKAAVLEVEVEAGKTYYFKLVTQVTFLVKDVVVKELTRKAALRMIKKDEIVLEPNCIE